MKNQLSAIKALFRFRIYTIINIIGLAISVAGNINNRTLYSSGSDRRPLLQGSESIIYIDSSKK